MKKRILSLVLCAVMLLSMCLFMGAGVTADTDAADGSAESTETVVSTSGAPEFQGVGPFMTYFPGSSTVRKAPMLRATAKDTSDGASNAVDVTKTATATDKKDADGKPIYQIDLTAAAKSNIVTHTKACDIVLVLDRSGSMNFSLAGKDNNSKERVKALQTAVNAFLTTIQKSSPTSRVAIVSYASDVTIDSGTKTASGALIPVTADNTVNSALTQIVSGLSTRCNGGTQSGKGLQQAVNIFNSVSASDSNYDNTRVTVLFTDGKPGNNYWSGEDEGYDVAQQSVHWSTILKHAKGGTVNMQSNVKEQNFFNEKFGPLFGTKYGVSNYPDFRKGSANKDDWNWTGCGSTVYCVGLGLKASEGKDSEGCKINEYMYRVSSHRPDGSHVDNNRVNEWELGTDSWTGLYTDARTRNHENGYYLTTDNAAELQRIFTQIAQQTGEAVKDVTIRDEISESFVPCDAAGNAYTVGDTITSNGKTGTVRQDANGNYYIEWTNVTLTPEQVDSNKVVTKPAETFQSTLYVKPRDGFLGGNNVPTNGENSGVYTADGNQIKPFPQPEVNVPIKLDAQNVTKNIYYGNPAPTPADLTQTADLADWQTGYVNINYTVDKNTISNNEDGTYQVTMTVSPKYSGDNADGAVQTARTETVMSTVNVYKPEITFKDSIIDYNATPDYKDNLGGVVWKHEGTAADPANMTGEEPALAYSYDPEEKALTEDTYVNVTVSANDKTLPADVVTFVHTADNDFPGCSFNPAHGQFIVHIKVFNLTIQKTAKDGTTIDPNQTFVFHVKGNNNDVDMQVVITGANKQVIKNLPVGEYTITEDTSWSWKYTPTSKDQFVTTSDINNGTATVTFENENKGTNWLTSLAKALNVWKDNGQAVERDPKN
ncbi:MAG: VWA domain-containing protein [Firmicutes bacterium]|jgi:Mg-chelatase subunit ChlD|nr:VWA domain-containing protein [Bacillota bacterium]